MREMPATFDDAVQLAIQLQSVETAQKRLHKELHYAEATALTVHLGEEQSTSFTEASTTNAVGKQGQNTTAAQLEENDRISGSFPRS